MYKDKPIKGKVCFCPFCHQFGKPAPKHKKEGVMRDTKTPIIICTRCAVGSPKRTVYLPGQGTFPGFFD
jgi:hypothetical protein